MHGTIPFSATVLEIHDVIHYPQNIITLLKGIYPPFLDISHIQNKFNKQMKRQCTGSKNLRQSCSHIGNERNVYLPEKRQQKLRTLMYFTQAFYLLVPSH
jgi:hypothetical protein